MKTSSPNSRRHQSQRGSSVAVMLALLAIMMICVAANTVALRSLQRELKLVESRQLQRLQPGSHPELEAKNPLKSVIHAEKP